MIVAFLVKFERNVSKQHKKLIGCSVRNADNGSKECLVTLCGRDNKRKESLKKVWE
jgi:hypothetical protein